MLKNLKRNPLFRPPLSSLARSHSPRNPIPSLPPLPVPRLVLRQPLQLQLRNLSVQIHLSRHSHRLRGSRRRRNPPLLEELGTRSELRSEVQDLHSRVTQPFLRHSRVYLRLLRRNHLSLPPLLRTTSPPYLRIQQQKERRTVVERWENLNNPTRTEGFIPNEKLIREKKRIRSFIT